MRTLQHISRLLLALSCVAVLSGCDRQFKSVRGGDEIRFSGRALGSNSYITRATYAGGSSYSVGDVEPIYWEVGDVVRVFCAQATHPNSADATVRHAADYKVTELLTDKSEAYIELDTDKNINGLHWNDDTSMGHVFYGVYPSPAVSGICRQISGDAGQSLTGTLPNSQNTLTGALASADASYVLAPDLKWQLMTAGPTDGYTPANFPATDVVFLTFKPLTTAIQFTLRNDNSEAITIQSLSLLSAGTQISGDFTISDVRTASGDGFPVVTGSGSSPLTSEEKNVSLALSSPVSLANGKTFTFTFFLAPVSDAADLKLQLTLGDGTTKTLRLGYAGADSYLTFPRCKKSFVKLAYTQSGKLLILDVSIADWKKNNEEIDINPGSALNLEETVKPWTPENAGNISYTD